MRETVDPSDFIITRKRKKYRFAKFYNAENCFELSEWQPRLVDSLEIGAGTGLFSVELAAKHPEKIYLALDVKADRLQKGAYEALARGLDNIYFVRARADQVEQLVTPDSLAKIWLTFSDPFPRARSAGRRMTHPTFLDRYGAILGKTGQLYVKHDNLAFFHWTLEQLVGQGWQINEISFDLHGSALASDYMIPTTYESRWLDQGRTTYFLSATKI